ncbi:closca [Haematobia irritans]|uniref:closca n=1 Tax=Haematobia irritans TaxID=7368 RepID=UPI003F4F5339
MELLKLISCLNVFILLLCVENIITFNVDFYYNYNLHVDPFNSKIQKRELQTLTVGKDSLSFVGFEKVDIVPVLFPIDICIIPLDTGIKYAAALHFASKRIQHFVVLKSKNGSSYEEVFNIPKPHISSMDCQQFKNKAYVSLASNISKTLNNIDDVSVIYEIADDRIHPVQYFPDFGIASNQFYINNNEMFLLQIGERQCSYFKWIGESFNQMGNISCQNVKHMEAFTMDDEAYVAMAIYKDASSQMETYSKIYKYSYKKQEFELFQNIKTYGAVDVRYFNVRQGKISQKFLVYGNTKKMYGTNHSDSMIYKFDGSNKFVLYQSLPNLYGVKKILPFKDTANGNCLLLLVSLGNEDVVVFTMENRKFRKTQVYFKGHNIRLYKNENVEHLVVTHRYMKQNEVFIYRATFKQDDRMLKLKQEIIDWNEEESKRLQTIDMEQMARRVKEKLNILENSGIKVKRDVLSSHINTVTTTSLIYPRGHLSEDYWRDLYYINQALKILEDDLSQKQRSKRQINNTEDLEEEFDEINIETLIVKDNIKATTINKILSENPEFKDIHAPNVTITNEYKKSFNERSYENNDNDKQHDNEMLYIRNLDINGKLNDHTWSYLLNYTLKRNEEIQFINAPIKIGSLKTSSMIVEQNEINGQNLDSLIPIDGGEYLINQDIQFAAPVMANNVEINERLNNVRVVMGKFDVLLRKSNETQVIKGRKSLNNVKVMEPITIAGQMLGRQLEAITPNKAIHQPINLQGDFMINADVDINNSLKAADIIDLREKLSTKQTLERGIQMNENLKDLQIKFSQPLKANNSQITFVNHNDLQRLVKMNQDDIQVVEGEKLFKSSLEISRGFSEVKNLNGIDIEELEKSAFLKNTNQTIKVPLKLNNIRSKSVNSSSILLDNHNVTEYLTKSFNQSSKGSLMVDNLKVKTIKVNHLNTNHKIFQQNIQDIYRQKSRNAPTQQDVFVKDQKFHGSIYVKNLILNSTINERNVEEIEKNLLQLEGNIKYVGNFKFNYPMNVTQLTFYGKFNDIPAYEFGRSWLQINNTHRLQEFVGPQTFGTVVAENGIHFQGQLNGFTINDFYSRTYWTNRDEYLQNVVFENPIEISSTLTTQTLNYHYIPEEFMGRNDTIQQIFQPLIIEGDLEVESDILNITFMKNINIPALKEYLKDGYMHSMYVENAIFEQGPPSYKTLNDHNIAQILDNVWLANENVILPQRVEINEANFEGLLEFEGPLNTLDLNFLKENYFSKTKSQNISAQMIFTEKVTFKDDLDGINVLLLGPIVERDSETSFDFINFVENTLKVNGHPYSISGNWSILEAVVFGNLDQVMINDMNLVDDTIHNIPNQKPYFLKVPKKFRDISIEHLLTEGSTNTLQGIPVANWIKDAVYLYENFTIYGTTTMSSLNVFNDLGVMGKINNISFNNRTLLLQNEEQTLPGYLRIVSHLNGEKRFLTNNIENLYTDIVNHKYHAPRFLENFILYSNNVVIPNHHMVFKQPLNVEQYQGPEGLLTPPSSLRLKREIQRRSPIVDISFVQNDLEDTQSFVDIDQYLRNVTKDKFHTLDHFEIRQFLNINTSDLICFSLKTSLEIVDIIVLLDNYTNQATFYKWLPVSKKFVLANDEFNWIPNNAALLNVVQKMSKQENTPLDIQLLKDLIAQLDVKFSNKKVNIEFWNETCLILYALEADSPKFKISCVDFSKLNSTKSEIIARASSNIQQIVKLHTNSLALITNNTLEIWQIVSEDLKQSQKYSLYNPQHLVYISTAESGSYLALVVKTQRSSLIYDSIQIYRIHNNSFIEPWQSLPCPHVKTIEYSFIPQSNDLLLYALTDLEENNFIVYRYKGIEGFKEIITNTIVDARSGLHIKMNSIKSSSHTIISIMGQDKLIFVELVLKKM